MPRPVRVRISYTSDRSRLMRLEQAVERDTRLTAEQRTEVSDQIRRLLTLLIDLDSKLPGQSSQTYVR